jgi:hypothetical protein
VEDGALALSTKQEKKLVVKLEERFNSALDHPPWHEWRSVIAPKCYRYREGDQWTCQGRAILNKRACGDERLASAMLSEREVCLCICQAMKNYMIGTSKASNLNTAEPLLLFARMGKLLLTRTTSKSWTWRLSDLALEISYC